MSLSPRRVGAAVAAGGIAFVVTFGLGQAFSGPYYPPAQPPAKAVPKVQPLKATDLQQVRNAFGPFSTIAVNAGSPEPDTRSPAILLLSNDSSVQASTKWTVRFNKQAWSQQPAFQISGVSVSHGYATFGMGQGSVFTVKCGQPFVLEDQPQQVVLIDVNAKQWIVNSNRALVLRERM